MNIKNNLNIFLKTLDTDTSLLYLYIIILKDMKNYTFETLTAKEARWYGVNTDCYIVRFNDFAPLDKLALVVNGKYTSNPKTGYIHGNGNLGTHSVLMSILP